MISRHRKNSSDDERWVEQFLGFEGHEYFCAVDRSFIEDKFNLFGLTVFEGSKHAIDIILDNADLLRFENSRLVELDDLAENLYALIHQRFILTSKGLRLMLEKYQKKNLWLLPTSGLSR